MRRRLFRLGLSMWGISMLALGTVLTARHELALPAPTSEEATRLSKELELSGNTWHAVHVLYAECRCSQRLVDHLEVRGRNPAFDEKVLLVGDRDRMKERLERRGFVVTSTTREALRDQYRVEAAPLLLVFDPSGISRYSGGYTVTKQGNDIRDLDIMGRLSRAESAATLPVAGCAVSDRLRAFVNPGGVL